MKIYQVIPIAKTIGKESLTYFGQDNISPGDLVSISLRKKIVSAIVIDSKKVNESKETIRKSQFQLKKITSLKQKGFLSEEFLAAVSITSDYFAYSSGQVLSAVLPKALLESKVVRKKKGKEELPNHKPETLVIQENDDDRFAHYKSFIRGEFAKNSSVFFCVPTREDLRTAKEALEKGIEHYTVSLHPSLSKKEVTKALNTINDEKHPILIIGTPQFLSLERSDLKSIILEKENSRAYRTMTRPYIDMRVFIQKLARVKRMKLIVGDLSLSVETLWHRHNDEYADFAPLKSRLVTSAKTLLVNMKRDEDKEETGFKIFSKELAALCDKTEGDSERMFIFCARKGLSPMTVCGDCGTVVTCSRCHAAMALYSHGNENIFICNKCGNREDTARRCANCGSWKLDSLGIGIERVEKELKQLFPNITLLRMDKEKVRTDKEARKLVEKFLNTPGSIMLGTELALLYLDSPVENMAVATIDPLFALPDFRINEKIFYNLLSMREKAQKVFLIQTRNGNEKIFDFALNGNLLDFYRNEISEREDLEYPPFSVFVKLTIEGKQSTVDTEMEKLKEFFAEWTSDEFQSAHLSKRGNKLSHLLFKFKRDKWPDQNFLDKARLLPPYVAISVDPENIIG